MQEAAGRRGVQLLVVHAGSESEVDAAFAALVQGGARALVVQADPYLHSRRGQLLPLVERHRLPAAYTWESLPRGGGLMSYGPNLRAVYRQIGNYTGRLLKGTKPADFADGAADRVRADRQHEDGQGARPHAAAGDPRARR